MTIDGKMAGPVTARERIIALDVLRGFALFGILLVNIAFFANPVSDPVNYGGDSLAGWLIGFFAQGKFYPLFALLFGLGFAMQFERAGAASSVRRMLMLFCLGLAHGTLVWAGDILTVYALLGLLMLFVANARANWLLVLAAVAYLLQILLVVMMGLALGVVARCATLEQGGSEQCNAVEMHELRASLERRQTEMDDLRGRARVAYAGADYLTVTGVRAEEFRMMLGNMGFFGAQVLAMFLIGAWLGRRGVFAAPERYRTLLRTMLALAVLAGAPLSAWFANVNLRVDYADIGDPVLARAFLINLFAGPLLALGYAAAIVLALQTRVSRWLIVLAPAGRMALTNYLAQSLICTLIFYSYGLGLMAERPGPPVLLALVLAVFALQLAWSHWWLRRFAFGPVEWSWRTVTYLRKPG